MITEYLGNEVYKIIFSSGKEIELSINDSEELIDLEFLQDTIPKYTELEGTNQELKNRIDELNSDVSELEDKVFDLEDEIYNMSSI